jgi:hypothetical protein
LHLIPLTVISIPSPSSRGLNFAIMRMGIQQSPILRLWHAARRASLIRPLLVDQKIGVAVVHTVLPFLCTATGNRITGRLHDRMILDRTRLREVVRGSPLANTSSPNTFKFDRK